jgi:peptide/nickel transport system substrate-binding protein
MGGNGNFSECNIPELDDLLERGRASVDENERKEIYAKACEIIRDNNVILPIYLPYRQIATNKDLEGITVNAALKIYSYGWSWK